jgi:NAD(P)H-dependent FMN reductase
MEKSVITIVVGTNRPESNSEVIAQRYQHLLGDNNCEVRVLKLIDLPQAFIFTEMFGQRSEVMTDLVDHFILKA